MAASAPSDAAVPVMITVHVDLISWVNQFVGGPGTGATEFDERVRPGETVRTVLRQLSDRFPKLKESLWDPEDRSQVGSHIEIIVNDAILGVAHELDSTVQDGDRITLAGQYIGG